jgi:hypothetical protein
MKNTMLKNFFKKFHFFHLTDLKTRAHKPVWSGNRDSNPMDCWIASNYDPKLDFNCK